MFFMASDVFDNLHGVLDELAPEEFDVAQDLADFDGEPNLKQRRRTNRKMLQSEVPLLVESRKG